MKPPLGSDLHASASAKIGFLVFISQPKPNRRGCASSALLLSRAPGGAAGPAHFLLTCAAGRTFYSGKGSQKRSLNNSEASPGAELQPRFPVQSWPVFGSVIACLTNPCQAPQGRAPGIGPGFPLRSGMKMGIVTSCVYFVPLAGSPRFPGEAVEKGLQGEAGSGVGGWVCGKSDYPAGRLVSSYCKERRKCPNSRANCLSISRPLIGCVQHSCAQPWLPAWGTCNEIPRRDPALVAVGRRPQHATAPTGCTGREQTAPPQRRLRVLSQPAAARWDFSCSRLSSLSFAHPRGL